MRRPGRRKLGLLLEYLWHCGIVAMCTVVLSDPSAKWGLTVLGMFVGVGTVVVMFKAAGRSREGGDRIVFGDGESGRRESNGSVVRLRDQSECRTEGGDGDA